jgi:hypothetical protein
VRPKIKIERGDGDMTDERFNELVNGPLSHPVGPLFMLRLANALRMVVERCGGAGDAALEAHCKEVEAMDHIKSGEAFTNEEAERAMRESVRRGGSKPV